MHRDVFSGGGAALRPASVAVRVGRWLESPRMPLACALLALLLTLPSLGSGLQADDHLLMRGIEGGAQLFELWRVSPARFTELRDTGAFAWWSGPQVDATFLRPLAELSHRLDRMLWVDSPALMHLENVLLYGLLTWLAALAFRGLLPARPAGLAALMFALNDAHAQSVGWISGRNTVLATVFGLASLLTLIRAPDRLRWRLTSALLLGLSLASAEAGASTFGYLAAYALLLAEGPPSERLRRLAPHMAIGACWLTLYMLGGYGVRGVGAYRDLAGAPLRTLIDGLADVPTWLFSQFGVSMVSALLAAPDRLARVLPSLLALPLLALLVPVVLQDRRSRFFALATGLAILPLLTTVPQDRTLMGAGLGGFGLVACALGRIAHTPSRARRSALVALGGLHLVLSPLLFNRGLTNFAGIDAAARAVASALPKTPGRDALLINSPFELISLFAVAMARRSDEAQPESLHQLYAGQGAVSVVRTGARTLEFAVTPSYCDRRIERLFSSSTWSTRVASEERIGPLAVTVLAVDTRGWPTRVRFRFDEPLEAPRYAWLAWQGRGVVPWKPPAVGQQRDLTPLSLMTALPH